MCVSITGSSSECKSHKMEVGRLQLFLLLILNWHLDLDSLVFASPFREGWIPLRDLGPADYYVLYKVSTDRDLLLYNTSNEYNAGRLLGYSVTFTFSRGLRYFEVHATSNTHNGEYRVEGWDGGNMKSQRIYFLVYCSESSGVEGVYPKKSLGSVQLCGSEMQGPPVIKLYRSETDCDRKDPALWSKELVLDTNASMEILPDDLRGRLKVDLNSSSVILQTIKRGDFCHFYECLILNRGQCQLFLTYVMWEMTPLYPRLGEQLTLQCNGTDTTPHQVYWKTPSGNVTVGSEDPSQPSKTHQEEEMYMLNGSLTGDYSLIITSVKEHEERRYFCIHQTKILLEYRVAVCLNILNVSATVSNSETAKLDCLPDYGFRIKWYRQKVDDKEQLILDSEDKAVLLPEDLRGRLRTDSPFSLVISKLTAKDSGVYTCRRTYTTCTETIIQLRYDPYGVHSSFYRGYASLLSCVTLVSAGILVYLRNRGRYQASKETLRRDTETPGQSSREDGALPDDMEMEELGI